MTIEDRIYDLKRTIENCENIIKANKKEIKKLEAEKEKSAFKRVEKGYNYYFVSVFGKVCVSYQPDVYTCFDDRNIKNNNYFHTKERAEEVADKINFLLKLERFHDIYCPAYKPDWEDERFKWYVLFDSTDKEYITNWTTCAKEYTMVYFDSGETACKVCEILNEEIENENMQKL